jgi:hypothetical protein
MARAAPQGVCSLLDRGVHGPSGSTNSGVRSKDHGLVWMLDYDARVHPVDFTRLKTLITLKWKVFRYLVEFSRLTPLIGL